MGLRTLFVVVATFLLVVLATTTARADAIPADLTVTGTIQFDTGFSSASGGASSSGTMVLRQGGTNTTSAVSGGTASGTNPLTGGLNDWGDGLGIQSHVGSGTTNGDAWNAGYDLTLTFTNTSGTETFDVVVRVTFDNRADADGDDAFVDSEFTIDDADGEFFATHLVSDTLNGDKSDGSSLGTSGASLTDSGTRVYSLTLAPGETLTWTGDLTLEGGVLASGASADSFFDVFVEIELGPAIPEPGTFILLGLGLAGVALAMRRRT